MDQVLPGHDLHVLLGLLWRWNALSFLLLEGLSETLLLFENLGFDLSSVDSNFMLFQYKGMFDDVNICVCQ